MPPTPGAGLSYIRANASYLHRAAQATLPQLQLDYPQACEIEMAGIMELDSVNLRKMNTMLKANGCPKWLSISPSGQKNQGALDPRDPLRGHPRHPDGAGSARLHCPMMMGIGETMVGRGTRRRKRFPQVPELNQCLQQRERETSTWSNRFGCAILQRSTCITSPSTQRSILIVQSHSSAA